ncbi:MAG TPA: segregation/condensation protein A [Candidatus Acidoferrales bacterium]|nr:segregation/condensation protein A [Candidatus Acidoferrales bacterium]
MPAPEPISFLVHLEKYEGPLDLLLDLIRKQEINIHDIPVARITRQYLEALHRMEELDINVSGDFLYMAATLIYIKSKMLLPVDPDAPPEEQDPRQDLVHQLIEHEKFKNAAQMLLERQQLEAHVFSKPDLSLYEGDTVEGELVVSLVDLVKVFQQILERKRQETKIELQHDRFTVAQMIELMRKRMATEEEGISLANFFEDCPSRHAMIVAFIAVLEMVRLQAVVLTQKSLFAEIVLRKTSHFETALAAHLSGAEAGTEIDSQYA